MESIFTGRGGASECEFLGAVCGGCRSRVLILPVGCCGVAASERAKEGECLEWRAQSTETNIQGWESQCCAQRMAVQAMEERGA